MSMRPDQLPPHDPAVERSLLGGILRDPEMLDAVSGIVQADSFYLDAHQKTFRAIADLAAANKPVDLVLLRDLLQQRRQLEDVGGVAYVVELWEAVPTGANATYHAKIVREAAQSRALIHTANEILRDAYGRVAPAGEMITQAEQKIFALAQGFSDTSDTVPQLKSCLREALNQIDARAAGGVDWIETGYADLDRLIGGMQPQQLVVVGARPSQGKSALMGGIAVHAAGAGSPVLIYTMEMSRVDIANRVLAMVSGVPMNRFTRDPRLSADDAARLAAVASPDGVGEHPIFIDDSPEPSSASMRSLCRRLVRKCGVRLVVVDYLQMMKVENPREGRPQQVGLMARRLKQMARESGVAVLCLAQLNREVEKRHNQVPQLSDIRESGEVEQHADVVALLHQHPNQPSNAQVWLTDILVRKNRNGPTGDVTLAFRRPIMRFENAAVGA
ncbi:MAG: dnaB [Gemmataceae bacterium]|nr:dnaB [Gemmataceae bacterium]